MYRADRQHQLVVTPLEDTLQLGVPDAHLLLDQIDRLDLSDCDTSESKHFPQRLDDISDGQIASGNLVQHRREKDEVFLGHHCNFHVRSAAQLLLEILGRVSAWQNHRRESECVFSMLKCPCVSLKDAAQPLGGTNRRRHAAESS